MDNALMPRDPDDALVLFRIFHDELESSIGRRPETPRLALLAVRHVLGEEMLRLLLIGAPGVGKTFMARRLSEMLDVPFLEFSVSSMVEEGWKGAGPSEHLATLYKQAALTSATQTAAKRAAERAVLLVDELDKAREAPPGASSSTRDNRIGKQLSLLPLIGDGKITIERASGDHLEWRSRGALVVCAGVFDGLEAESPSAEDLTDWGLLPELAERLAFGTILRVRAPDRAHLIRVLYSSLAPIQGLFSRFGYRLGASEEVLHYLVNHLIEAGHGARSGMGILRSAAEEALLALITGNAEIGTVRILQPDDVRIPRPAKGIWRE